ELAAHARIDLDDADAVGAFVPGHLDVEETTRKAETRDAAARDPRHALLHDGRQRRGIDETREAARARVQLRVHDADHLRGAVGHETLDRDLAPGQELLRDEVTPVDGAADVVRPEAV